MRTQHTIKARLDAAIALSSDKLEESRGRHSHLVVVTLAREEQAAAVDCATAKALEAGLHTGTIGVGDGVSVRARADEGTIWVWARDASYQLVWELAIGY